MLDKHRNYVFSAHTHTQLYKTQYMKTRDFLQDNTSNVLVVHHNVPGYNFD